MLFQNQDSTLSKKEKRLMTAAVVLLLLLQLSVLIYYGSRKTGFHEDEFYSYYTTNKTAGLFVNDRTWVERDAFRNDFVVLPGEGFRYEIVKQMQSWDVHPPFYYYLLHTVCSLTPEVFSKWQGIAVNLAAFVPCFFLLFYLVWSCLFGEALQPSKGKQKYALYLAFGTCLFWGFGAAVISGVMFIRMYQWLTLFVLLCGALHIKALKEERFGAGFLIPLAITVFFGFLTQYYYIIFHFFLGLGFCCILLYRKQFKHILRYGISCIIGFGCAVLYYPASFSHIFRGYRGTEAVSEFGDASNTLDRLRFFGGLFDDYVMNGCLSLFLLAICLLWVTEYWQKTRHGRKKEDSAAGNKTAMLTGLLLFACAGYFFTVSKTALLLAETSNRYQLPIYGIVIFLLLYYITEPVVRLVFGREVEEGSTQKPENAAAWKQQTALQKKSGIMTAAGGIFLVLLLLLDVTALADNKVFFLYEEEAPMQAFVKENRDVPVVVFYHDGSPANVWRISDQLMEFPRIYLASQGNEAAITEADITESDRLLVYVADYDNQENCLENLLKSNDNVTGYEIIAKKGLWTLYEMK